MLVGTETGAETLWVTQLTRGHIKKRQRAGSLKAVVNRMTPLELTANTKHFSRAAMEVPKRSVGIWEAGSPCKNEESPGS